MDISNINARYGGTAHDSYVWSNSQSFKFISETLYQAGIRNTWLILLYILINFILFSASSSGDSGYAQSPWMMTPIAKAVSAEDETYNVAHRKARNCVERCIGVLKGRFRYWAKTEFCDTHLKGQD